MERWGFWGFGGETGNFGPKILNFGELQCADKPFLGKCSGKMGNFG